MLFFLLATSGFAFAQVNIQVEELTPDENNPLGYNADTLKRWVQEILRGRGGMIDTTTIKFTGDYRALGRFMNGSDIGFDKGLIISNGKVKSAEPPNSTGSNSYAFNEFNPLSPSGDPDLLVMYNLIFNSLPPPFPKQDTALHYTGDAAALEFVYRPFGDQFTLEYIFASEEYPSSRFQTGPADQDMTNFPNTPQIFDLFGISISNNPVFHNLAFTPPTLQNNQPPEQQRWVTVQHINAGNNPSYFHSNPEFGQPLGTQYDGLTRSVGDLGPLIIKKNNVTPCGRYYVKIVIEDFFWISPDPAQKPDGFEINSALFLNKNSLRSSVQMTNTQYSDWSVEYEFTNPSPSLHGELVENCNDIIATFILEDSINQDYSIPFKIFPVAYRDSVQVGYVDGPIITNDSITIERGATEKKIVISAININADHPNIQFQYPENPCDFPPPPPLYGGYHGKIYFNMRNNEPISFTQNPKIYDAYCKETLELTITDITENGVTPLFYRWENDVIPHDTITYKVQSSPDYVQVTVSDYCSNESTMQVQINNKAIELEQILDAFLCGPGQSVVVPVSTLIPNYSDYTIDHVQWYKVTPYQYLGDADGNEMLVLYDNVVGDGVWTCGFEITDCCGGTQTGTFLVNQSELSLGDDVNICNGDEKEIIANAQAEDFKWYAVNNPSVILSNTNWVIVSPSVTTEYALWILDLCGVEQTAYITVIVDLFEPQIIVDPASKEICPGDLITLTANDAVEWNWTPGNETTQMISLNPTIPDVYEYTLTASSVYCFDKVASTTFEVFPTPIAEFSIDPSTDACTGETIYFDYLEIVTNEGLVWDFDDGSPTSYDENPTHVFTNPGTYYIHLHVQKHICDNDTVMELIINPLPTPDFDADIQDGCLPVDVNFDDLSEDIQAGATYEWNFGDGQTSDIVGNTSHEYTQAGVFNVSLIIHNTQRCAETIVKNKYIQVNPNPEANFEPDPPITTMDTPTIDFIDLTISDSTIISYEWDFGDGTSGNVSDPSHVYTNPGNYTVTLYVVTTNGCYDSIIGYVALTEEAVLFIPNAFTPNNDGVNDKFEIKGTSIADYNLYIYDRWGGVVWSTHNFEIHWDGTDKSGNPVNSGTYIYQIVGTDYLKQGINYQGTVTVIR